ncbi:hypothetical protein [Mesorhizobium sp. WSM4906]|uniref:hypothetical protein n=1 Tax=Mesorhizobium sp. WSM4906 TaxID=3038546 RepID=UPI0024177975|nr:hypothetical protein [Mesorhizobium sp. WSM4906]WFP75904.1 hypothetical protein QAZ22_30125 [Mesorhizobium sp. WSM4906]
MFQQHLSPTIYRQIPGQGIDLRGQAFGVLAVLHRLQGERGALLHPVSGLAELRGLALDFRSNPFEKASQAPETPLVDGLVQRDQRHFAGHSS